MYVGCMLDVYGLCIGMCMGCVWDVCGMCTGCVWDICGVCVGCLWDVYRMCLGCVWDVDGMCMGYIWDVCEMCMDRVWDVCGICMGWLWDIYGVSVGCMWAVYGIYMGWVWAVCGVYMGYVWAVYGICVGYVWAVYGLYMGCVWDLGVLFARGGSVRDGSVGRRWMYWTDWEEDPKDSKRGKIERAWMDGSNRNVFITSKTVLWPNGLSLDIPAKILYWVDAFYDRIEMVYLNGTERKVGLVPVGSGPLAFRPSSSHPPVPPSSPAFLPPRIALLSSHPCRSSMRARS